MLTDLKRVIKSGLLSFWRNGFVSIASILVITITLFVIGSLIFFSAIMDTTLAQIKEKVDVDVYFLTKAPEDEILSLKQLLEELPEVSSVKYTTGDEALTQFKERHSDDYLTLQALEELGENPLGASLNIQAKETAQYESIARFLDSQNALVSGATQIIDSVNYYQNKAAIDKLTSVINGTERIGLAIAIIFGLVSFAIAFNTIRLAIYTSREEISVMKLVGASKHYIQGPFLVEGFMYAVISTAIVLLLFYPITLWLGPGTAQFFGGINIFTYYIDNFFQIFGILLLTGIILGVVSSYLAVRKYLNQKYLRT